MKHLIVSITSLLAGIAILLLGHGLAGSLLALRAAAENFPREQTGLLMSSYFLGYILGAILCPKLINRVGYIRMFAMAAALCSTIMLLHGLWVDPWFWMLGRFFYGAGIVSIYLVVESWLNERATPQSRGRVFAIYMLTNLSALAAGQYLLLLGEVTTLILFVIASLFLTISLIPVSLTSLPEPAKLTPRTPMQDLQRAFALSPLGFVGCFIAGLGTGAFMTMGPVFASDIGMPLSAIASFMGLTIAGGALMQWPIGLVSDGFDRSNVLAIVAAISSLLAALVAIIATLEPKGIIYISILYGGFFYSIYSLCVANANDAAGPDDRVPLAGGLLLSYGIGAVLGPSAVGFGMTKLGPNFLPISSAIGWLALAIYGRTTLTKPARVNSTASFSPMTRTTVVSTSQLSGPNEP